MSQTISSVDNSTNQKLCLYQPVKTSELLKELLELEKNEEDENNIKAILDTTLIEETSTISDNDSISGINVLKSSPPRKPFKIVSKVETPLSNMFNRLSAKDQSVKKEPKTEEKQYPLLNAFKTPLNKNMKIIPSCSSGQRQHLPQYPLSSSKRTVLECITPKQDQKDEKYMNNLKKPEMVLKEKDVNVKNEKKIPPVSDLPFKVIKIHGKDYIVINKIGEGGSGQVYKCLEKETFQDRAVKVINLIVDPASIRNYYNEIKVLKDLQESDRVIKMYDYEQINKCLYVVMEKGDVDFSNFLKNIINQQQIQTHIIVCYWIEMLKCVKEIHQKGIIHSDLKPSNFLIVGGRLKLIDFGIASRLSSEMTSVVKNVQVGTFNYMSPEALLDSRESPADENLQLKISYKSDVWSLGCILYQMVYKRTPFHHVGNTWAKFAVITDRNHKIQYPTVQGIPQYLFDMIKMCLRFDMRSRPTVDELLTMYYNGKYY